MKNRSAIRQALHLLHGMGFTQIARLTGSDASSIRRQALSGKSWESRSHTERAEAIAEAKRLVDQAVR